VHNGRVPGPSFRVSVVLPTSAERLYRAFLDSKEHAAFTGAPASITARVSGKFSAFEGHVTARILELEPNERIVMDWRTKDFPDDAPDSRLEVLFHPATGGTRVTFAHAGLPPGSEERFRKGWKRFYLGPMRNHFQLDEQDAEPATPPKQASKPKQAAAKTRRG
jgi:activator of HSP90 ATPase